MRFLALIAILGMAQQPALGANLLNNGDFRAGLTDWTTWRAQGQMSVLAGAGELSLLGSGSYAGGVYQVISTGGAGRVVTLTGRWRCNTPGGGLLVDVLAINADRVPLDGHDEAGGVRDTVGLYTRAGGETWNGTMAKTASGEYRVSFVAAAERATVVIRCAAASGPYEVLIDDLDARSVPAPATLDNLPEGFALRQTTMPHDNGGSPAQIECHPLTGEIYAIGLDGRLYAVNPDTMQVTRQLQVGGLSGNAQGLAFDPDNGNVYVSSHNGNIVLGRYSNGLYSFSTYLDLPESQLGEEDHGVNALVVHDGWLYINSGSATKQGPEEDTGLNMRILRAPKTGATLANVETYARGCRNTFDLAMRSDGVLFGVENGPNCHFAEEFNRIEPGGHYGFPFLYGSDRSGSETDLTTQACPNPTPPPGSYQPAWGNYGPDARPDPGEEGYEDGGVYYSFEPHSGPDGLTFYEPERMDPHAPKFPREFHGRAFVARLGNFIGESQFGRDVLSLRLYDDDEAFVCNTFLSEIPYAIDVLAHPNGRLYILTYGGGSARSVLYEVSYPGGAPNAGSLWSAY